MFKTNFGIKYVLFAAALLAVAALQVAGTLAGLQNFIIEKRSEFSPRPASGQIVFIGIDKKSIDQVGVWPWPRSVYAKSIGQLVGHKVADIAIDVDFSTRSSANEDRVLADALKASGGGVILPMFLQSSSVDVESSFVERSKPLDMFASEAWMASVNVIPDSDGLIRTYAFGSEFEGEVTPSLSNLISGNGQVDTSRFNIDFSIQPSSIPTYSFADLISGKLSVGVLENKTVVVGAHALELRDNLTVPVHGAMMGPVLQIIAAETLLQQRQLKFTAPIVTLSLLLLMSFGVAWASRKMRLARKLLGFATIAILIEIVGFWLQAEFAIVLVTAPFLILATIGAVVVTAADFDIKSWLLRIAKLEVHNTKSLLDQVFADSSDAILIIDESGSLIETNERFCMLFGLSEDNGAIGRLPDEIPNQFIDDAIWTIHQIKSGIGPNTKTGQLVLPSLSGETFVDYSVTASNILVPSDNQREVEETSHIACVTARDVTVETMQKRLLKWQSEHDNLTGAERRAEFVLRLGGQIENIVSASEQTHVLALGIHRFSAVNATLGREVGDGLLRAVAKRLEKLGPWIEGISRLDSASFAIRLNSGSGTVEIFDIPTIILDEMSQPYAVDGQQISVDVCIGRAGNAAEPLTATELLEQAEFALEEAIKKGPHSVCDFDPALNAHQMNARKLEREMDNALLTGQFHMVYQPQVAVCDGSPSGAEALIRWRHPELGIVSPAEFVEIAEANGMIEDLGRFALKQACLDAASWPSNITIAVNVSPQQFTRGDIVKDVAAALQMSGLAADRLELEITESSFLANSDDLLGKMNALKRLGIALSLDDFGTGYSSLGYFSKYPLDKIKVDRTFITDIGTKPANQSILQSIKVLADGLGIKVLCEGVETEDELRVIRLLGCDSIQGYYFGKPQSLDEITAYFADARKAAA